MRMGSGVAQSSMKALAFGSEAMWAARSLLCARIRARMTSMALNRTVQLHHSGMALATPQEVSLWRGRAADQAPRKGLNHYELVRPTMQSSFSSRSSRRCWLAASPARKPGKASRKSGVARSAAICSER